MEGNTHLKKIRAETQLKYENTHETNQQVENA